MIKKTVTYAIDILVVLVILAVGLYGYKLISNKALTKDETKTIFVTVEFEKSEKNILEKIKVGDEIMNSSKNELFGTVKTVSPITDSVLTVSDYKNGKYVKATTPEYGLQTIVLECKGTISPTEIKAEGTEIRIGSEIGLRTSEYTLKGKIMKIDFEE